MTLEQILPHMKRRPFQPLRVTLKSGESYEIAERQSVLLGRTELLLGIQSPGRRHGINERVIPIDHSRIANLEPIEKPSSAK